MSRAIKSIEESPLAAAHDGPYPRVFVSYARAQFYFTESLVYGLQANNFRVWFDSQQLSTGTDWAAAITNGLASADALVLVGSERSLGSSAVRHEWTTALAQGKKVVVALFEGVALPPELHAATVVDFRRSFSEALTRLQEVLRGEVARQEGPKASARRIVAFPVRMIAFSLVFSALTAALALCVAAVHAPNEKDFLLGWVFGLYVAFLCTFLVYRARAFLRRDFRRGQVQAALVVAGIVIPLAITKVLSTRAIDETYLLVATGLVTILSSLLAVFALWLFQRSPTIFRWLPTGEARSGERVRNTGMKSITRRSTPLAKRPDGPTFTIESSNCDRYVVRVVARQFARSGWMKAPDGDDADLELVLASADTDLGIVAAAHRSKRPPVVIVTSNGVRESELGALVRYQWIDFRRRRLADLRRAATYLAEGGDARTSVELNPVPERLLNRVIPIHLRIVLRLVYLSSAILILFALITLSMHGLHLLRPVQWQQDQAFMRPAFDAMQAFLQSEPQDARNRLAVGFLTVMLFSPVAATLVAVAMAALVTGLGWLANAVTGRRLSRRATLSMACAFSLGWLLNVYFDDLVPFAEFLGLIGLVLVIGELRYAWLPSLDRSFREQAREALTDVAGWRETRDAIGLVIALLLGGTMLLLSFA